ncbi:hypothetical protein C3489_09310 [Streptomyces sp. Ru71]|nr:hypothetical protein C3489_09310 [Streptomyces sp. Ru71]
MPEIAAVFERVLDQALDSRQVRDALDRANGVLDREQLRIRAVGARTAITAAAAVEYRQYAEYQEYVGARCTPTGPAGPARDGRALPPPAVLLPGVCAVVAAGLLATGYGLRVFDGRPYIGGGFVTAGLLVGALAVGAAAADLVWAWATAPRGEAEAGPADARSERETREAREAWELALLERGVVPFLLGRVEEALMGEQLPKRPVP